MKLLGLLIPLVLSAALVSPTRPATSTRSQSTFGYVDLHLDPHGQPFAAWQLEFIARDNSATLVGVEAGDSPAFKDPPHYDSVALSGNRIILAAYSTAAELPTGRTRIARLHLQFAKPDPAFDVRLITAAASDGAKIDAAVSVSEGAQP